MKCPKCGKIFTDNDIGAGFDAPETGVPSISVDLHCSVCDKVTLFGILFENDLIDTLAMEDEG